MVDKESTRCCLHFQSVGSVLHPIPTYGQISLNCGTGPFTELLRGNNSNFRVFELILVSRHLTFKVY